MDEKSADTKLAELKERIYDRQRGLETNQLVETTGAAFKARSVKAADPDNQHEKRIIDRTIEFCRKNNSTIPGIYIFDSNVPNAVSVGGQFIAFTSRIIKEMSPEQLDAIIGHELSHHRHALRDGLLHAGLLYAGLALASHGWGKVVGMFSHKLPSLVTSVLHSGPVYRAVGWIGALVSISPLRHFMEYEADREGAKLTNPDDMQSALKRLEEVAEARKHEKKKPDTLVRKIYKIVRMPISTHPSTPNRLEALEKLKKPDTKVAEVESDNVEAEKQLAV